jgi:hypothetical protein
MEAPQLKTLLRRRGEIRVRPDLWVVRLECGCVAIVDCKPISCDSVYCILPSHHDSHAMNWRQIDPEGLLIKWKY